MYILLFILSFASAFACQNDAISIVRRTGIGSNSNGNHSGSASHKVNIPVLYKGNWGCWEQTGGLSFEVKEKKNKMTVLIPKSSFKDLPGRMTSYAMIKDKGETLEIDIANFVCVGTTVLAAESFSGSVTDAMVLQQLDVSVSTTFATGVAAANLARQREELARRFGRKSELTGGLEDYFNEHFRGQFSELEKYDLMVPSVYLGASMKSPLSNLTADYHTRVLTKGACSHEFESVMSPLRLENLRLPKGIKARVKKGNLELSW